MICLTILICFGTVAFAENYQDVMGRRQIIFSEVSESKKVEINPEIRAYYAKQESTVAVVNQFENWLRSLDFRGKTLGQLMKDDSQLTRIISQNLLKDFYLEDQVFPDGKVQTTLTRTWNGTDLARALDRLYRERNYVPEVINRPTLPQLPSVQKENTPIKTDYKGYTGVVIDSRNYQVRPSMAPKIFDSQNEEVYGTMDADPDYVIEVGIVGYAYNLEEAIKDGRVGDNPLVVKAVGRSGNAKDRVIIPLDDADFIRELANNSLILSECKVMFIIDERR